MTQIQAGYRIPELLVGVGTCRAVNLVDGKTWRKNAGKYSLTSEKLSSEMYLKNQVFFDSYGYEQSENLLYTKSIVS